MRILEEELEQLKDEYKRASEENSDEKSTKSLEQRCRQLQTEMEHVNQEKTSYEQDLRQLNYERKAIETRLNELEYQKEQLVSRMNVLSARGHLC